MDKVTAQRVVSNIDENEAVRLASDLIKIPSFKTEETPVAIFLSFILCFSQNSGENRLLFIRKTSPIQRG